MEGCSLPLHGGQQGFRASRLDLCDVENRGALIIGMWI